MRSDEARDTLAACSLAYTGTLEAHDQLANSPHGRAPDKHPKVQKALQDLRDAAHLLRDDMAEAAASFIASRRREQAEAAADLKTAEIKPGDDQARQG